LIILCKYFKTDHAQAQTDLNELGISSDYVLFENINVTVHRNNRVDAFRANPTPETDIRLKGKHTVRRTYTRLYCIKRIKNLN
jgi:hypothetical protein